MVYESNEWLQLNKRKIENIQYMLTEISYKNENPGIPIAEIRGIIGATIGEIKKLQKMVDTLTATLKDVHKVKEGETKVE